MTTAMKTAPHQEKYKNKMKDSGYTRITVWVPEPSKDELMGIINEMRDEHDVKQKKDNKTKA